MKGGFYLPQKGSLMLVLAMVALLTCVGEAYGESLYREGNYQAMTDDHKAFRVGDVITVQVYENSSASTSTDTSTQRKNDVNGGIGRLSSGKQVGGSIGLGSNFDGGGTTQRTNKLLVTLTVSVRQVLPNGDLQVAGEQLLTINDEQHKVSLEGRVRPQDISPDNTVQSIRLADAKISYAGDGSLSDRQQRAWWNKLLDWLGF